MDWLNYHHLRYFWTTARHESVTKASQELHLTPQTVSAQVKELEQALGHQLFVRVGRRMELTDLGRQVYRYADEIFGLGRELVESLRGGATERPLTLHVGVADALPKLITHHLLQPALLLDQPVRLVCRSDRADRLIAALVVHELDVVLSDGPIPPGVRVQAYNHLLGESGVVLMGAPALARRYRRGFPRSLDGAPLLIPSKGSALRSSLTQWYDAQGIRPAVVAEFDDSALLKAFGQTGAGMFPVASAVEDEVRRHYGARRVGTVEGVVERFYAISVERRVRHPAVAAICASARDTLPRAALEG